MNQDGRQPKSCSSMFKRHQTHPRQPESPKWLQETPNGTKLVPSSLRPKTDSREFQVTPTQFPPVGTLWATTWTQLLPSHRTPDALHNPDGSLPTHIGHPNRHHAIPSGKQIRTYTCNPSQPAKLTEPATPPATELPIGLSGSREALTITVGTRLCRAWL